MPEVATGVLLYSHPIQYKDLAYTQKTATRKNTRFAAYFTKELGVANTDRMH